MTQKIEEVNLTIGKIEQIISSHLEQKFDGLQTWLANVSQNSPKEEEEDYDEEVQEEAQEEGEEEEKNSRSEVSAKSQVSAKSHVSATSAKSEL